MKTFKIIYLTLFFIVAAPDLRAEEVDPVGTDPLNFFSFQVSGPSERRLPQASYCSVQVKLQMGESEYRVDSLQAAVGETKSFNYQIPSRDASSYKVDVEFYGSNGYGPQHSTAVSHGPLGSQTSRTRVSFTRIDVNHMKVTRQDGTTYSVKGRAKVYIRTGSQSWNWDEICDIQTGYGLDVLPGNTYRIKVWADTEDGVDGYSKEISL